MERFGVKFSDTLEDFLETEFKVMKQKLEFDLNNSNQKLRLISFICNDDPLQYFRKTKYFDFNVIEYHDFRIVELSRKIKRDDLLKGERIVKGSFGIVKSNIKNVWTAFTGERSDFIDKGLSYCIKKYSPHLTRFYMSSVEIRKVLKDLEEKLNCEIIVEKAIIYNHDDEGSISFRTLPFFIVFNDAKEKNMIVDKVEFKLIKDNKELLRAFISRNGETKYISGDEHLFFDVLLHSIEEGALKKKTLFSGKRRELGKKILNPLGITYGKNVFESPNDNLRLIRALNSISKSSLVVYHKNPYAHVSFLDFIDGSTYDIFVTGPNSISIIPSFRSSEFSLMRVCDRIWEGFEEGVIKEEPTPQFTHEDFF